MRTIFAEYNPQRDGIDVYSSAGYMLRIDCWEAEKNLTTTPRSDCALNAHDIYVYDDELAKVIKQLSDRYRENVLMYYFLDMSDTEIAKLQNISRSGVFQNRHYALKQMKKSLEEEN